jgi:serine/threonine protein kinase
MKKLDHINIVKAVELFHDKFSNSVYTVLEFVDGKEILDDLVNNGVPYSEENAKYLVK